MKLKLQQKFRRVRQKKKAKISKNISKYVTLDDEEDLLCEVKKHMSSASIKHAGIAKKFKYAKQRDSVHWSDATGSVRSLEDFTPVIVETFD